ncbi:unnamed protein product [Adineta steineri]|uniref:fructose-bisphosphatase n=1 Tax=Adineta steineri TaxID=433720 RepID=A0A814QXR3_9BILA|nr:unnamed protein product [Adineta steineri]CAF1298649.1 unnamed protein product [Adineta steineri]CAF4256152.1 unnamed protein product [Adineta steineri]
METECTTVTSFVLEQKKKYPGATGELTILLNTLLTAIKACAAAVRKAGIAKLYGLAGSSNTTGDDQKKLDVLANELFINMLKSSYTVYVMASEENENYIEDSIGSIFGIWKKPDNVDKPVDCILQSGEHLRCSGYAVYGSACMLVLATQEGVNGYAKYWDKATTEYVHSKKFPEVGKEKPFANRYVGSMVADVHRTLMYGGVLSGGASSNGQHSILKIQPQHIHQRSPVFLGYKEEIEKIEKLYQQYPRHTWAHE